MFKNEANKMKKYSVEIEDLPVEKIEYTNLIFENCFCRLLLTSDNLSSII